jgi:hypothetical protein
MGLGGGRVPLGWPATAASPEITMEIHISDRTHKFQSKTRLDAKANSELYKSKRVCSVSRVDLTETGERGEEGGVGAKSYDGRAWSFILH